MSADPVAIARDLLRCRSITPAEGGALKYLERVLKGAGFIVHHLAFSEPGEDMVENLYARLGTAAPHLMFAGHTDVVPPGDETAWTHPPFAGDSDGKELYGRGAVDMKGGLACALAAVLDHLVQSGGKPQKDGKGSISFLITGDEEGRSEEHTSELQSHSFISYALFCLKKKKQNLKSKQTTNQTNDTTPHPNIHQR